ncbi:MAG: helix-turn-helix domain-containing protein, partial [Novipirellula sp. JB048]
GFFAPAGSHSESIALHIHQQSAPREALAIVDGPLMDPELLDASIASIVDPLTQSPEAKATALVRGLDEMPLDAQRHLVQLLLSYGDRMRLLGLCSETSCFDTNAGVKAGAPPQSQDANASEPPEKQIDAALADLLASLTVTIAPLSARSEDIPLLAAAVVDARHAAGEGIGERLSRAALDALVIYPWPNNFAELDAAMRQAVRMATREAIGPENLPLAIRSFRPSDATASRKTQPVSLDALLESFELKMIHSALQASDGNRAAAARLLGITRSRLLRRLESDSAETRSTSPAAQAKQPGPPTEREG